MEVREYYNMLYSDLLLKIMGFENRRKADERIFRKVGFSAFISSGLAPKGTTEEKYWPIDKKSNQKDRVISNEKRSRIQAAIEKQKSSM